MKSFEPIIGFLINSFFSEVLLTMLSLGNPNQEYIPIYFQEFGVQIRSIEKIGDTLDYNKSSKEDFKFVFYDTKGKSYCEHFINGEIFQKGNFENSLDTLKRYVSGRKSNGQTSPIQVQQYFQPLKNGEWLIFKKGKVFKTERFEMGIQIKHQN